jgi:ferredoxin
MTYVVTESCILCKHTDCVDVCPVDCFVEGPNFLAIDPDGCIDCAVCVTECPVNAIVADKDLVDKSWLEINARLAKKWPVITKRKPELETAEKYKNIIDKRHLIEE